MKKIDTNDLLRQIKENHAKLNSCARHDFGEVIGDRSNGVSPRQNMRTCKHCGGVMEDVDILNYAKGYKAAGGDPDDIGRFVNNQILC